MLRFPKIIIITFALYMLLCIPALAAQTVGGYVSNTPVAAGPNASIGEVWMRHGGARLQYDALMGSIQTNTNGRMRRDPAAVTILPPLYPQKKVVRKAKKSSNTSTAKKAPIPKKVNPSPKPSIPQKTSENTNSPYTGTAPIAPSATEKASPIPSASPKPVISSATPPSLNQSSTAAPPPPNNPILNTSSNAQSGASTTQN